MSFDQEPCPDSRIEDLATDLFRFGYPERAGLENQGDVETQLASLRFFDLGHQCPTNAGIVLFAKNPLHWLPGAYLQFLRLAGPSLTAPVAADRSISGDLSFVIRDLHSLVNIHTASRPVSVSTLQEKMVSDYPAMALLELLMNAVMHRSYESNAPIRLYWFSDRVEIHSPGGLFGEASPGNFPARNGYRNPVLAGAMKALGFVHKTGRGIDRVREALTRNGNPPASFEFYPTWVLTVLRPSREFNKN